MTRYLKNPHIVSIEEISKEEILYITELARKMKNTPSTHLLEGCILASCFFEPSTRTRLSFEAAMHKLGGRVIGFSDGATTSAQKGETLHDTMKVIGSYADVIVIRHPLEGAARLAAESAGIPVINAGDGANQHPTQTLVDLFTILEFQKELDGLKIALAGDLKHARTIHSLAMACSHFGIRLYFISPPHLAMPDAICSELRKRGVKFSFHSTIGEVIDKIDVLYMTRLQKERLGYFDLGQTNAYESLSEELLQKAKPTLKVLQPLPRLQEIPPSIDKTPYAHYFTQAANGVCVRQALLALLLKKLP